MTKPTPKIYVHCFNKNEAEKLYYIASKILAHFWTVRKYPRF